MNQSPIPILGWLPGYRGEWLRFDAVAGMTAAAVVIPQAMAYATIAGLPVEVGLYTAFIPMLIYAILGTSRPLSFSTTSTIAILVAAELALLAPGGDPDKLIVAASTLALLVGAFLLLAGIFRMGFIANFISDPVLTGFKAGVGLVIVVDQVPKLLGVHFAKGPFFQNILSIFQHLPQASIPTLLLALVTLALRLRPGAFPAACSGAAFRRSSGHRGFGAVGAEAVGCRAGRQYSSRLACPCAPGPVSGREIMARGAGHRAYGLHESIAAGRAFIRRGDSRPDSKPGINRSWRCESGGWFFPDYTGRWRNLSDSGE